MAKTKSKTTFECQACGARTPKWIGRCTNCGAWNQVTEVRVDGEGRGAFAGLASSSAPLPLTEVEGGAELRMSSEISEFDRVLGGGIVAGSAVLVGGDPGIGKSTLLLQVLQALAARGKPVLYVTGEESARQVRLRADRLGGPRESLFVFAETDVVRVLEAVEQVSPAAVVVDSVQTLFSPDVDSAPGTVSQVREVAGRLIVEAKRRGTPVFLVGHVTKEGAIAGPRVLEHMVDAVLYFEGDRGLPYRILRAVKNRFGSTNEVGVFEMADGGLQGIANASALFLSERPEGIAGSAVVPCVEGTRTLLVEIQALVAPAAFASPQRTTSGVERNRVHILAALIERKLGVPLLGQDLFVNVAGGLVVSEPAADLGIVAALLSGFRGAPLPSRAVFFGEVGLGGEVRRVSRAEARLVEAAELGFRTAYVPRSLRESLRPQGALEVVGVASLAELAVLLD